MLKKRVVNMFHKRNSYSDSSRGTSTQTIASPPLDANNQIQDQNQNQTNEKLSYVPHSPYYVPAHPPEFYEDE